MKNLFGNRRVIAALVLPGVLVMLFSIAVPIVLSVYFGMTNWSGFGKMKFIGLDNYREILTHDPVFWRSLLNALILAAVTIFLQNPVAFVLSAIIAKRRERTSQVLRTVYFIPAMLSLVVIAKLWVNIFNPTYGLLNKALAWFGLKGPAWLSDPGTALWAVIWIIIWQGFGWALLFYYSGLMTVPRDIEEAARVDGANTWQTYTRIVLPFMAPVLESVFIIDVVSSLKQMEMIFLSTAGGPGTTTQFIAVYVYQKAFDYSEYGYGNALSVLFVVVAVGLTLVTQRLFRSEAEIG